MVSVYAIDGLTDADDPVADGLIPHLQKLSSVSVREGRMIAFPNTLQYRLGPAELCDPTRPGYIYFLTLCLADPNYRLISTGRVVPQRYDWWMKESLSWGIPYEQGNTPRGYRHDRGGS